MANLATLSEYCIPLVKVGGSFISYKAGMIDEELNQAKNAVITLGGSIEKVEKFQIHGIDAERTLIQISKKKRTSLKYPRKAGVPGKEPL